ncbi:16S rRNA (cytosine(967)-C(5))-methyltransferase RsmB [Anaerotalea alkaliphila]|uniref:16S rRNA (cytosine(967)-C(5))-methyltransferase n=1 Tax=Anaerotalea alkaliphila TaxID=2662126 RepID=A0A7X5KLN8_9FIRM|nr:16S rRNA (cytosine(967)-C(5))-methyltransferase RsmB [Anaerotalea alkaliphila]NDL66889.1 16S rRNA (cytosine(967)-C(5))-methyltransferase RsmB [Anaerotalea alkaliphila]
MTENGRMAAVRILERMEKEDLYVNRAMDDHLHVHDLDREDRKFVSRLVYGTVERMLYLDHVLDRYSKVPSAKMKKVVRWVLRTGVYQILFMDGIRDAAVCDEAVKIIKKRKMGALAGYVNAVLRTVAREKDSLVHPGTESLEELSLAFSMPLWLLEKLQGQMGFEPLKEFCLQSLGSAPLCVRPNLPKVGLKELEAALDREGVAHRPGGLLPYALFLDKVEALAKLESFRKGLFQVQDQSSQLVGEVVRSLELGGSPLVLDVCAAPGGKSTHVAGLLGPSGGRVVARDISPWKLERIGENVERLGHPNIRMEEKDASRAYGEDRESADVVLADAPCSGLGILRRKPDIKYRLTPDSLESLGRLQKEILEASGAAVKPGGFLVYSTCTVNREENEDQVMRFLEEHKEFKQRPIHLPFGALDPFLEEGFVKLMPKEGGADGFFIALLEKEKGQRNG